MQSNERESLQQLLDSLRTDLTSQQSSFDFDCMNSQSALTISTTSSDTINLSNTLTTSTFGATGQYNYSYGGSGGTISVPGISWNDLNLTNSNNDLLVHGDANFEGDLKIKGKSLIDSLEKIEEKLAILRPNEELEEKWEQLRELRNRYIELEKDIIAKEKVWNILKK